MPDKHDYVKNGQYKKLCDCADCDKKWKEWCEKKKKEGETKCRKRCYTVCEYECEQPVTTVYEWGHTRKFEGKWEKHHKMPRPAVCEKCKQKKTDCRCGRK